MVAVLALLVVVWCATAAATWVDARHELDELLDGHLAQAAALLVVQQTHEIEELQEEGEEDYHSLRGVDAPNMHRYAPKAAFQVWHEERLLLRSSGAPLQPMGPDGQHFADGFRTISLEGESWRVFTTRGAVQSIRVYVAERIDSRAAIGRAVLRSVFWPAALALPLLGLGLWWVIRRALAPLRDLSAHLERRAPSALKAVELSANAPEEMRPMVDALNGLLGRIAGLMEAERRFTADAAHELRTPIAAIRAQAQVAMGAKDDAPRRHALLATLEGCDRATHLVTQLLTLSRLEAAGKAGLVSLDLAHVAQRVLAQAAPQALAKNQQLSLQVGEGSDDEGAPLPPVPVQGLEALLEVLLRNLVDNAIRYAPAGAQVQVQLQPLPSGALLCVDDSGPGMGEADIARLGERFFRVLGTEQSGSGLGWSIVRRIAALHRAEVTVERSASLEGLRVSVTLS
ncbi:MAG: ATP-binding protein [Ideonella sp.]|nr:ATP-binding protein [Ideonella sp.]